ncbi:RNA polymerase sigma factor [Paenibacillus tyrfis]|uniref:RNA polymerase sigma factor n=1 Tax=Paenibacillus tyrfis TaxID=1501230 RepID=UPI000B59764B|nr:RNA polymerase sigma factor [Paenibacillus tyrfis]
MSELAAKVITYSENDINEAFLEEISPHLEKLRTYCKYLSTWDGEDLYQETLLKAFIYRMKFHHGSSPFTKALLFRIAKNMWIDMYRKHRGRVVLCEEVEQRGTDSIRYDEVRELIEHVADHVSERHVNMLLMFHAFHYSIKEIALISNTSVPSVKTALHRTRTKLRKARQGRRLQFIMVSNHLQVERWVYAVMSGDPSDILADVSQN